MRTRDAVKLFRAPINTPEATFSFSTEKRIDILEHAMYIAETYGNEDHTYKKACCIYLENNIRYPEGKILVRLFRLHCQARHGFGFKDIPQETWLSYSKETRHEIRKFKLERFRQLLEKILLAELFLLVSEKWEYNEDFTRHAQPSCLQLSNFLINISCPDYLLKEVSASYKNIAKARWFIPGFIDHVSFDNLSTETQTKIRKEKVALFKKEIKKRRLYLGEGQKFIQEIFLREGN